MCYRIHYQLISPLLGVTFHIILDTLPQHLLPLNRKLNNPPPLTNVHHVLRHSLSTKLQAPNPSLILLDKPHFYFSVSHLQDLSPLKQARIRPRCKRIHINQMSTQSRPRNVHIEYPILAFEILDLVEESGCMADNLRSEE